MSLHEIEAKDLQEMSKRGEVMIVDVREPYEYGFERIPCALLMPLASFDPAALPTGSDRKIVFHCAAGARSQAAANKMMAAGIAETYHLKGGIAAWKAAGLPLVGVDPMTGAIKRSNGA